MKPRARICLALLLAAGSSRAAAPPPAPTSPPPDRPGVRTLYLVRHGAYDEADPRDAAVGKGLVPIGVAQARLVGARLRAVPFRFDALYTSPLTRALEVARPRER